MDESSQEKPRCTAKSTPRKSVQLREPLVKNVPMRAPECTTESTSRKMRTTKSRSTQNDPIAKKECKILSPTSDQLQSFLKKSIKQN